MQQQDEHQQPHSPDNALYDRYAASIFAYARLHTTSWEDAEDLTLEVFLTALERMGFLPASSPLAYETIIEAQRLSQLL